jgi:PPP family 3-phenylpropionic acid transporter
MKKYEAFNLLNEANRIRILYFTVFCCTASWLPLFADYLKDRSLTGFEIGIILGIAPLMMFLVQPFYGLLADRWGYKKTLLLSSACATICFLMYLFDGSFLYLFGITILMAGFYNTLQPVLDSLALKFTQINPSFSYGTLRIAGAMGWAFTGILVGYSIDYSNTTIIFVFSAVSMLLTFLFSFALQTMNGKERVVNFSFIEARALYKNKALIFLLICVFFISVGSSTIYYFYSIYMKENGASSSLIGYALSFQGLCEIPFFYFSAKIIKKLGLKTTFILTVFATAIRLFLYSVINKPELAIFIEVFQGISWSLFWVCCVENVNILVQEKWRATGQSLLYASFLGAGAIVGNLWTGFLYDRQIPVSNIFLLNTVIVLIVGIIMWIFMKSNKNDHAIHSSKDELITEIAKTI